VVPILIESQSAHKKKSADGRLAFSENLWREADHQFLEDNKLFFLYRQSMED
jgi:hypothetical protein